MLEGESEWESDWLQTPMGSVVEAAEEESAFLLASVNVINVTSVLMVLDTS